MQLHVNQPTKSRLAKDTRKHRLGNVYKQNKTFMEEAPKSYEMCLNISQDKECMTKLMNSFRQK